MITYNQEDVIQRAMDSILSQKDWGLYQIIIGDDCSKDRTYDILLDYQKRFPDIVRPYRNKKNLGIYGNLQNIIQYRDDSDLYTSCSGDDAYREGYFQSVQELIDKECVPINEAIGIYSDWMSCAPDGKEAINSQELVSKGYRLWGLHMRGHICGRSLVYSKAVIDQFKPIVLDRGLHLAEGLYGSQAPRIIKKSYYIPKTTTIYYSGIGVSTRLSKTGYATTENIVKWDYYINYLLTEKRDIFYAKYQIQRSKFIMYPTIRLATSSAWYHFRGLYPFTVKDCLTVAREWIYLVKYSITQTSRV